MKVMRLMYQLSQRYRSQDERYALFRTAIEKATRSIYTIVREVGLQGQQHGKALPSHETPDPEEKRSVRPEQLTDLEKLAVIKIVQWANDGRLCGHRDLISILYMWKRWSEAGERQVADFVDAMIQDDKGLVALLAGFEGKAFVQGWSDHVGRIEYRLRAYP